MPHPLPWARALLGAATTLALLACNPSGPDDPDATFRARWAGARWQGDARAVLHPGHDTLYIGGGSPVGAGAVAESSVSFQVPLEGPGAYELGAGAAYFHYLVGGDVLTASYGTTGARTGTVVIEEQTDTRVRGRVSFDAAHLSGEKPAGDRARFEGSFDAVITIVP